MTNPQCQHLNVDDGNVGNDGYVVVCRDCGADLTPAAPSPPSSTGMEVVREWEAADMDRMVQIKEIIANLQSVHDRFGNTCVYIRRGGLSWGAVALNRRDDDKKFGVFDLQAQHDRDMTRLSGQVERLIADKTELATTNAATIEGLEREATWAEHDKLEALGTFGGRVMYYNGNWKVCLAHTNCELWAFKTETEANACLVEMTGKANYSADDDPVAELRAVKSGLLEDINVLDGKIDALTAERDTARARAIEECWNLVWHWEGTRADLVAALRALAP